LLHAKLKARYDGVGLEGVRAAAEAEAGEEA
jgi:hypothetical protein